MFCCWAGKFVYQLKSPEQYNLQGLTWGIFKLTRDFQVIQAGRQACRSVNYDCCTKCQSKKRQGIVRLEVDGEGKG